MHSVFKLYFLSIFCINPKFETKKIMTTKNDKVISAVDREMISSYCSSVRTRDTVEPVPRNSSRELLGNSRLCLIVYSTDCCTVVSTVVFMRLGRRRFRVERRYTHTTKKNCTLLPVSTQT